MTLPEVQVKLKDLLTAKHWSTLNSKASERNFYTFLPIRTRSCKLIFNEDDATRKDWCEYWTVEKYLKESMILLDKSINMHYTLKCSCI